MYIFCKTIVLFTTQNQCILDSQRELCDKNTVGSAFCACASVLAQYPRSLSWFRKIAISTGSSASLHVQNQQQSDRNYPDWQIPVNRRYRLKCRIWRRMCSSLSIKTSELLFFLSLNKYLLASTDSRVNFERLFVVVIANMITFRFLIYLTSFFVIGSECDFAWQMC